MQHACYSMHYKSPRKDFRFVGERAEVLCKYYNTVHKAGDHPYFQVLAWTLGKIPQEAQRRL